MEERFKHLIKILKENGFELRRNEYTECGSGERYVDYPIIDISTNSTIVCHTFEYLEEEYLESLPKY